MVPMSPKAESGARRPIRFLFLYIKYHTYQVLPTYTHTFLEHIFHPSAQLISLQLVFSSLTVLSHPSRIISMLVYWRPRLSSVALGVLSVASHPSHRNPPGPFLLSTKDMSTAPDRLDISRPARRVAGQRQDVWYVKTRIVDWIR